jgi:hypothetical protein
MLHEEPTDTYIDPSGPKTTVRVEWPPRGRSGTTTSRAPTAPENASYA